MRRELEVLGIAILFLAAALILWLTISGPPNLREWQTLMAAMVALGGGALAYRAALMKVAFDRHVYEEQNRRSQLALLLQLNFAVLIFKRDVERAQQWADGPKFRLGSRDESRLVKVDDLKLATPAEFEVVWKSLHLLPETAMNALANIRAELQIVDAAHAALAPDDTFSVTWISKPPNVKAFVDICGFLLEQAQTLHRALVKELAGRPG